MIVLVTAEGHVNLETLGGSASLTVCHHEVRPGLGPVCIELAYVVLDPPQVLELATQLTRASVPPPPVVRRAIRVVQDRETRQWQVVCPECWPPVAVRATHRHALATAFAHLASEHGSEVPAA